MSFVVTANNFAGRDNRPPAPALKENGDNYQWRMFFNENREIIDADSLGECLAQLIPNYLFLTEDEQFAARIDLAKRVQLQARSVLLANADPDDYTDWEWDVLNFDPTLESSDPYGWGEGEGTLGEYNEDVVDVWSNKTPLVLVETNFDPFTDKRRPISNEGDFRFVSNLVWLEPGTELDFLRSLSRIGYVSFGTPRSDRN